MPLHNHWCHPRKEKFAAVLVKNNKEVSFLKINIKQQTWTEKCNLSTGSIAWSCPETMHIPLFSTRHPAVGNFSTFLISWQVLKLLWTEAAASALDILPDGINIRNVIFCWKRKTIWEIFSPMCRTGETQEQVLIQNISLVHGKILLLSILLVPCTN